jgi:hypothetical protein
LDFFGGHLPNTLPPQDLRRVELGRVGVCTGLSDMPSKRAREELL